MLYIRVQDNNVTPQVLVIELAPVFTQQPLSGCWNSHDVTSYAIEYI